MPTDRQSALFQVKAALRADHDALHELLEMVRTTDHQRALASMLRMLQPTLRRHFEREEMPGGFYDQLGAAAAGDCADKVRRLRDDHSHLLALAHSLAHLADSDYVTREEMDERIRHITSRLRAHEDEESSLAEAARGAEAHA